MEIVAILARGQFATFFTTRPPSYSCASFAFTHYSTPVRVFARVSFRAARGGDDTSAAIAKRGFATSAGLALVPVSFSLLPLSFMISLFRTIPPVPLRFVVIMFFLTGRTCCSFLRGRLHVAIFLCRHLADWIREFHFCVIRFAALRPHSLTSVTMRVTSQPRACVSIAALHSLPSAQCDAMDCIPWLSP